MAADLLTEGKAGNDFMERVCSSVMIEIKCPNNTAGEDDIVRVPEAIACSLAGRISTLVGTGIDVRREITIEELMGGDLQYSELKEQLGNGTVLDYLTWFVQWMYTSKLEYKKDLRFFGMWIFASKIECPRLQNDAEKKRQYYFAHAHFANNLFYCAENSGCWDNPDADGFSNSGEINSSYWENKKCLLFLLDCTAYFGPGDRRLRRVLQANELLYFVAEPNSCDTIKEEPTLQTPLRKRRLYSSNVSVANDSHKRIRASSVPKATIDRDVTFAMTDGLSSDDDEHQVATRE
ncbi:hypothetical protein ACEPPN_015660 [Leptodophora sp. 'Broadleaf-Isolate-01']